MCKECYLGCSKDLGAHYRGDLPRFIRTSGGCQAHAYGAWLRTEIACGLASPESMAAWPDHYGPEEAAHAQRGLDDLPLR